LLLIGAKSLKEAIDVKKRLQVNSSVFEFLILIFLLLASLLFLKGCTLTPKALQLANEKAAPQYEYRNIKKLVSAVKHENGDVSLCIELNTVNDIDESKLNTMTIPFAILSGEANQQKRYGLLPGECPSLCYWYPIEKVENGCEKITPENLAKKSIIPIEKLFIYSQDQLYDFINSYDENQKITDKIFEVSYVSKDISEIYWFARIDQQRTSLNSIAGVYEDKSTNLYYLTVAPAVVGDVIIVVVAAAVVIAGIALGVYLRLL
jgi:hypothetical protein